MADTRRKYDPEFRAGAVGIVLETKRSIAEVARELGINDGTLGNWVKSAAPSLKWSVMSSSDRWFCG